MPTGRMILRKNATAENVAIVTGQQGMLSIVGTVTTETVAVQVPVNEEPSVGEDWAIDRNNNSLWTPFVQEDEALVLSAGTNVIRIPGAAVVRLVKVAGVAGNTYGVRWM